MIGLADEYTDPICPGRSPANTGTVMDNCSPTVVQRFFIQLGNNLGSTIVAVG